MHLDGRAPRALVAGLSRDEPRVARRDGQEVETIRKFASAEPDTSVYAERLGFDDQRVR
jgi:hypothetical protein